MVKLKLLYKFTFNELYISGLIIVFFGYSFSHLVLHLYGGRTLSEGLGPDLLRSQCFLILFLAINGVTECFARAVMTDSEINTYTQVMTLMSVAYILLTYTLASLLGPVGMVMANCCNMVIRIAASVRVIVNTFRDQEEQPIMGLVPDTDITLLLISAGATCLLSEVYIYSWSALAHLAIGAVMFLAVVVAVVVKEDYILTPERLSILHFCVLSVFASTEHPFLEQLVRFWSRRASLRSSTTGAWVGCNTGMNK